MEGLDDSRRGGGAFLAALGNELPRSRAGGIVYEIYNIHWDCYGGVGAWALGGAVAAWALRSMPNAALAVVLASLWGAGFTADHQTWYAFAPFLVGAVFLPLAWMLRSRIVF